MLPSSFTRTFPRMSTAFALTAVLCSWGQLREAQACSPSDCSGFLFPSEAATLPTNSPAIGYFREFTAIPLLLELRTNDGVLVETEKVDIPEKSLTLLLPKNPLTNGQSYEIHQQGSCGVPKSTFKAQNTAELPLTTGKLVLAAIRREQIKGANSASCSEMIDASTATFAPQLSLELEPFAPVLYLETTVDGELWNRSAPGVLEDAAGELIAPKLSVPGLGRTYRMINRIHTACGEASDKGVSPGKHLVAIRAVIPGHQTEIQPATLEVELSCEVADAAAPDAAEVPDAAAQPDAKSEADAAPDADNAAKPTPDAEEGGCSTAAGPVSSEPVGAGVLMLGLALLASRARRRPTPPRPPHAPASS